MILHDCSRFRAIAILLLLLCAIHTLGCLQSSERQENSSVQGDVSNSNIRLGPLHSGLELDFDSSLGEDLFRTWGTAVLWSNSSLPYLMFNSSLMKDGRLVESTRYLLIDVQPSRPYSFEICENGRFTPAEGYICQLDVSGPQGPLQSMSRQCQVEQSSSQVRPSRFESDYYYRYLAELEQSLSVDEKEGQYQGQSMSSLSGRADGSPENGGRSALSSEETDSPSNEEDNEGYVGSKTSKKYHLPTCRYAVKILPEKKLVFASREEAESRGYEPCKVCNP